ncbi:8295_t:CDS:2 [Ambispora gerdemannii]|uniref:8295_t:CDS:1 n=1 Tax=Ambispora gerdemannii TaxID=144530 RepID=A0A9N9H8T4_9GLOM|nr:8295_t:CDS:2 [Ambispora gerdemannii]
MSSHKIVEVNAPLSELSGSLGDLGTLLPILVALSITGQVSLTASLIFGGEVTSAGLGVGSMIFILGITKTIKNEYRQH